MVVPLLIWGAVALAGAIVGGTAVVATTDAADEFGDAVERSANSLNRLLTTTALVGGAFLLYQNRADIRKMFGG